MWRKIRLLLIFSGLIVAFKANAQFDDPKTIEIGPHVGASYYMGDINPAKPFAMSDLQYGGVVRFNYNNRWTFRFDYSHATVKADDAVIKWRPERNLCFTTKINDFSLVAEFNFWEYFTGNPKRNVSPYIFGGISVFHYIPYVDNHVAYNDGIISLDTTLVLIGYEYDKEKKEKKWHALDVDEMDTTQFMSGATRFLGERGKHVSVSIPFGVGVKFALSKHMAATVEWRMQKTFTDYLDDVGGVYMSPDKYIYEKQYTVFEYDLNPDGTFSNDPVQILNENGRMSDKWDTEKSYLMRFNLVDPSADPVKVTYKYDPVYDENGDLKGYKLNTVNDIVPGYKQGQQRGNSAFNDWFGMIRVSLTWKFNLPDGRGCNLSKF